MSHSFETEFKDAVTLAKLLELKWFHFYAPSNPKNSEGNCDFANEQIQPNHCMPFLRRNLSYVQNHQNRTFPLGSHLNLKKNYMKNQIPLPDVRCQTNVGKNGINQHKSAAQNVNASSVSIKLKKCDDQNETRLPLNISLVATSKSKKRKYEIITPAAVFFDSIETESISFKTSETIKKNCGQYAKESSIVHHRLYHPKKMGPPKEFRSHFALFSKSNREKAVDALPIPKRRDKYEVRKQIIRMWDILTPSEVDFWNQECERDRCRYEKERKIYFKSLRSKSFKNNSSKTSLSTSRTTNKCYTKPSKVLFHYKYLDKTAYALEHIEMRRDLRCPLCFFLAVSGEGLMIHCVTNHHGLMFTGGLDEDKNLHISVCRNKKHEDLRVGCENLINFNYMKLQTISKQTNSTNNVTRMNIIPFIERTYQKAANEDCSTRKKKIRALSNFGADNDIISRYKRSDKIPLRQYYHSRTNLPMQGNDWDFDSDDDSDDEWLHRYSQEITNEFEDVSTNEKIFMLHWNRYIKSHTTVSDRSLPQRCLQFVQSNGEKLISPDLRQNLLLHLCNLWEHGLISSTHILRCIEEHDKLARNILERIRNNDIS